MQLRSPEQAAAFLGVQPSTLAVWRCTGRYPLPYVKVGRKVFYQQEHLERFVASRTHGDDQEAN